MYLKELIKLRKYTYSQVANYVGIDKYQLCKIANYVCLPTPHQLQLICNFLKCKPCDIYKKSEITFKTTLKAD